MLVIRFFRTGKKNQPSFKIVVTDKRESSTTGRFVEEVGFWNPLTKEKVLKGERIKYWLSVGAKPSNRVYNLLVTERMKVSEGGDEAIASATSEKIVEGKKIDVHKKAKEKKPAVADSASVAKATSAKETAMAGKEEKPKEEPVPEKVAKETPKEETSKTE